MTRGTRIRSDLLLGLSLRGLGAGLSFALTWLIAQMFGAAEVGLYQLGLATALLFGVFASAGLDLVLLRKLGVLLADKSRDDIRATFWRSATFVGQFGFVFALLLAAAAYPIAHWLLGEPEVSLFLLIFAPVALLAPALKLSNVLLRSSGKVVHSQVLEGVSYTALCVLFLGIAFWQGSQLPAYAPAIAYVVSLALVAGASFLFSLRFLGRDDGSGTAAVTRWEGVRITAYQVVTQAGTVGLLLLVSAILGLAETGIFRTAFQIAMLLQLVSSISGLMAGPHLSEAIARGDMSALAKQVKSVGAFGAIVCLPLVVAGIAFPELLLGIFGEEFETGALALQILLVAFLLDVTLGLTGLSLVIMQREGVILRNEIVANAAGVGVAWAMLPSWGMVAAAVGVLIISAVRNTASLVALSRVLRESRPGT